jgi:hypothetical protein
MKKKRRTSTIFEAPEQFEETAKKSPELNLQLSQTARAGQATFRN